LRSTCSTTRFKAEKPKVSMLSERGEGEGTRCPAALPIYPFSGLKAIIGPPLPLPYRGGFCVDTREIRRGGRDVNRNTAYLFSKPQKQKAPTSLLADRVLSLHGQFDTHCFVRHRASPLVRFLGLWLIESQWVASTDIYDPQFRSSERLGPRGFPLN